MYSPSISPYDENFLLLTCDMGGVYRSLDKGNSWHLVNWNKSPLHAHVAPPPVFLPKRVFWVSDRRTLCFSDDKGATWTMLPKGPWENAPLAKSKNIESTITSFTVSDGANERFLVSTDSGVWFGEGKQWKRISDKQGGPVLRMGAFLLFTAGEDSLFKSSDNGKTWQEMPPLPGKAVAFTGAVHKNGKSLLLISIKAQGLYRSEDLGATWQISKTGFENEHKLAMPPGQIDLAYALQTNSVNTQQLLKTKDGGKTWASVFHMPGTKLEPGRSPNVHTSWIQTQLHWNYHFTKNGLGVSALDHNFCLVTTQAELYVTRDGGSSWSPLMANILPPFEENFPRHQSIGLEITSCWSYYFDPIDPQREYIAYTDLGFAHSFDQGTSWSWSAKGSPWGNTYYDLVMDPDIPGRLYAAASGRHDIPHYAETYGTSPENRIHQGGVVVSDNWGKSWAPPYTLKADGALPLQVCTTIALDPTSPPAARVLYAGISGENKEAGVYVSSDSGKTWRQTEGQPGILPNRHVYRLRIHPVTGDLYCLITGYRAPDPHFFSPEGGGVWVSSDRGKSWRHISKGSQMNRWATSFAFDPANDRGLYVSAATPQGGTNAGGIYMTPDGGKTWWQILKDRDAKRLSGSHSYDHWMAIAVHPDNPDLLFAGSTLHGLFFSLNKGKRWQWCREYPFRNAQSITFNPRNTDTIVITSFGAGVWTASIKEILKRYEDRTPRI